MDFNTDSLPSIRKYLDFARTHNWTVLEPQATMSGHHLTLVQHELVQSTVFL